MFPYRVGIKCGEIEDPKKKRTVIKNPSPTIYWYGGKGSKDKRERCSFAE
jgi:hypothetical protein